VVALRCREARSASRRVRGRLVVSTDIIFLFFVSLSNSDCKVDITGIVALQTANFPCVHKTSNGNFAAIVLVRLYLSHQNLRSPGFHSSSYLFASLLDVLGGDDDSPLIMSGRRKVAFGSATLYQHAYYCSSKPCPPSQAPLPLKNTNGHDFTSFSTAL
jgi:hypothetical protein